MSIFNLTYRPKNVFDLEETNTDTLIMTAEGVLSEFKAMKKLGVKVIDNQNGIIGMECETTDPQAIIELKKLGFEKID